MSKAILIILLISFMVPVVVSGDEIYENQLNKGIRNSDPYAYLLIKKAEKNKADSAALLKQAVSSSPDLPASYFAQAGNSTSFSGSSILLSIDQMVSGFNAYGRNFWWIFTLSGTLYFSLLVSFVLAYIVTIAVRLPRDIPLITHDITESPVRAAALLLLLLLSVLSPLLLIAGILVLFGIYMRRTDKAAVYTFIVFLMLFPLLVSFGSMFVAAPSSGNIKAVVQANEQEGNAYPISVLGSNSNIPSQFSYALALKREGQFTEAIDIYTRLTEKKQDPRVLVNLGNCYVGLYNFEEEKKGYLDNAMKHYMAANASAPLASAYYNMSLVARELLNFEKGDEYFRAAQAINRVAIADYSTISARQANRFVADETLSMAELWGYVRATADKTDTFGLSLVSPGIISLLGLLLLFGFLLLPGRLHHIAYRCRKCNVVLCSNCERELVIGQICSQCYGSLLKLAELDVKERVARILAVYEQQARRRNIMKVLSFVMPGTAHIFAGKILLGFFMLWPFLFCSIFPVINAFFYPASGLVSHGFIGLLLLITAVMIYLVSHIITRQGIAKGWL